MANNNLKTVLVVDDSPTLATLFSRAAENMDVQLEICDKTSLAWTYLESNKPDLIFLNIKMPGKDGLVTLKELRKQPLHNNTPVVMISSKDYAQDRSIANELGALEFITKPMPIQVIKDALIKHLDFDSP
ncbi:MAG: DNA-binding response OmpR family regulator [Gammaproteobacteria bacterium]|jgi:DNA-binding response OmpR family regulator